MVKISSAMWRCTTAMLNRLPRPTFESDEPVPEVDPEEVIVVAWCDGQSFERHGGFKKRSGKLWRNLIPFDGPFHEHAHAIFAYVEMYWQSFLFWALSVLKRERVHEIMQSLDDSAYSNYQEAISEIVVGVVAYLLLDVQTPPPRVYLSNPKVYSQLVRSASGHVLLKFLKYAGWPTLAHLYCARAADAEGSRGLYAYDYHIFRSVAHKPNYVSVTLQQLATYEALQPQLRPAVDLTISLSPLGRMGSNVYPDRYMEMRNKLTEQRGGLGGELDTKLHTGPELDILTHAAHVRPLVPCPALLPQPHPQPSPSLTHAPRRGCSPNARSSPSATPSALTRAHRRGTR